MEFIELEIFNMLIELYSGQLINNKALMEELIWDLLPNILKLNTKHFLIIKLIEKLIIPNLMLLLELEAQQDQKDERMVEYYQIIIVFVLQIVHHNF